MRNLYNYEQFMNNLKLDKNPIVVSKVVSNGSETYTTSDGKKFTKNVDEDLQQMADLVKDPSTPNTESDLVNDPNRTIGTGTYTPNNIDKTPTTKGSYDTKDSATSSTDVGLSYQAS